jgi:hypothetical protein
MNATPTTDEPYPGLRSFRHDESHIFFGRDSVVTELVDRLAPHRFLIVTGASASGKSSLVRTGLLNALDLGLLTEAGADWRWVDFRPGSQPLLNLAVALTWMAGTADTEYEAQRVEAMLARGPLGLVEWCRDAGLSRDTNVLVLVDQFEEIFRFVRGSTSDDVDALVAMLLASAEQREVPIYVVITMRADFLGECVRYDGLAEMINHGLYLTPRLTREQCREVIEQPVAVFGGRVEGTLVNRLLNDMWAGADQLPLVQHVLMRLWRTAVAHSGHDTPVLTLSDYEQLGGIANALSAHADEVLAQLTEQQQRLASILFQSLTANEGDRAVRRPTTLEEIAAIAGLPAAELMPVVDAFRAPHCNFLVPASNIPLDAYSFIDISHESLLRQWGRLRGWLDRQARSVETYRQLESTAKLWRNGTAALLTMPHLGIAKAWRDEERPNARWAARYGDDFELTMEFLARSEAAQRRRPRLRAFAAALALIIGIGIAYALYVLQSEQRAGADRLHPISQDR